MDYAHAAYFAGTGAQPQYHPQFIGIPPLTPSHSNSATSDDFNTTSPPEGFADHFPNEQFQTFEQYAAHFNPHHQQQQQHQQHQQHQQQQQHQQTFPGPPTPPNQHPVVVHNGQSQPQPHRGLNGSAAPPAPAIKPSSADVLSMSMTKSEPNVDLEQSRRQGSGSDDEELTPAQSRRKAQNRAAQRAFRERKERHVKDLEAKLASLEAAQNETATENERLKRDLQKVSTENEILRATSAIPGAGSPGQNGAAPTTTGPMSYNPTDFYSNVLSNHENKTPSHRIVQSDEGERLLAAGATWEYIIGHPMYKRGLVDIGSISELLKSQAKCDGQGPVFEERAIIEAIEQSVASGSDELI